MALKSITKNKEAINALGPMLPGSISTQWNVCGKSGCRCKDQDNPKKAWTILSAQLLRGWTELE